MKLLHLSFFFCCVISLQAQKTSVFAERTAEYERGLDLYDKGVYGAALTAFEKSSKIDAELVEPKADLLSMKSQLMMSKSAVRIGKPDAEMVMLSFFRNNTPDALAYEAVMDLGNYYYAKKNYEEAISFYNMVDPATLSDDQKSEIKFKQGYAQFVKKKYSESKASFGAIKNLKNKYYEPANYYYGLSAYYTNDFDAAVAAFKTLSNSKKYKTVVPIHICQILLAQKKYDELIAYAEPLLEDPAIKKQAEVRQILGQAYFEMGDYEKAMPYLEEFANSSGKKREEDIFQLGVAQYKLKEYTKAIGTLKALGDQNTEMGMYAMFYMADSYLRINDKSAARNAFFKASGKKFDPAINEEALFNYAKLSVELGFDREAITTLQAIKPESKYYAESQELISDVLINTKDYEKALKLLETIPNKSPKMTETYQKVLFYRGIQLHTQKSWDACQVLFTKALNTGSDIKIKAQSHFFLGDAMYNKDNMKGAKTELNQFLAMADDMKGLPPQSGIAAGNYDLGYIYLKEENYVESLKYFEKAIAGFKNVRSSEDPFVGSRLLPDATLRAGDSHLKKNNYAKAKEYYDIAIDKKYPNFVYALFQNAVISGLQGNTNAKLSGLKNIADKYSDSDYADDALLEMGNTYEALNRPQEGLSALKRLVNEQGKKSNLINKALLKMGLLYYNQNDYDNALKSYKDVYKNNPNKEEADAALVAIKEIYVTDLKKPDEFFAYAETIPGYKSSTDEKDVANFQVAENYYEDGDYKEAITAYGTYIKKYPKGARTMEAYYHRGESNAALKQYDPALADYKYVIGLGNSDFYKDALEKAAIISYNFSNDFEGAFTYYSTWAELETKEDKKFEAQIGALRSAYRIGKQKDVVRLADLVINSPRASMEQKSSAHFFRAKSAQDIKDYSTALKSYNEVVKNSETVQTAESRYRIAQIYFIRKDLETAEQLAQESMEANGEYPYWVAKSLILTADILTEKGDYFNAKAALEAVIENFQDDQEILDEANNKLAAVKKKDKSGNNLIQKEEDTESEGE